LGRCSSSVCTAGTLAGHGESDRLGQVFQSLHTVVQPVIDFMGHQRHGKKLLLAQLSLQVIAQHAPAYSASAQIPSTKTPSTSKVTRFLSDRNGKRIGFMKKRFSGMAPSIARENAPGPHGYPLLRHGY
jgi:hypothetical protein